MDMREIYNKVALHLLTQGRRATAGSGACAYRGILGPNGRPTTCSIGCLIKDEFYRPDMEGAGVQAPTVRAAVEQSIGRRLSASEVDMLSALQYAHDRPSYPNSWAFNAQTFDAQCLIDDLARVARIHKLI